MENKRKNHKWRRLVYNNAHEPKQHCADCDLKRERIADGWVYSGDKRTSKGVSQCRPKEVEMENNEINKIGEIDGTPKFIVVTEDGADVVIPVLKAYITKDGESVLTESCFYCASSHIHGVPKNGLEYRQAHCSFFEIEKRVDVLGEMKVIDSLYGYFIYVVAPKN